VTARPRPRPPSTEGQGATASPLAKLATHIVRIQTTDSGVLKGEYQRQEQGAPLPEPTRFELKGFAHWAPDHGTERTGDHAGLYVTQYIEPSEPKQTIALEFDGLNGPVHLRRFGDAWQVHLREPVPPGSFLYPGPSLKDRLEGRPELDLGEGSIVNWLVPPGGMRVKPASTHDVTIEVESAD
jgi:hypothetical protein